MPVFHCRTCGAQYPPADAPPDSCPICEDERQYVGLGGQAWVTVEELAADHTSRVEEVEPGLVGVGVEPFFAIGQRALLVDGLLWDCVPLLDDAGAAAVEAAGGVDTIAISHPHYYTGMADLAERLDARILLHEADRAWITRPTGRVELWSGDHHAVGDGLDLIRLGGHFEGGTVCVWAGGADGRGALLSGDIVQVIPDREWVSFMYSYPNLIPLPAREIARIRAAVEPLAFDRIYGAWWPAVVDRGGHAKVLRSADRYIAALDHVPHARE
jgi:hypothetical protein